MVVYAWIENDVTISLFGTVTGSEEIDAECARERGRRSRKGMYAVKESIMSESIMATGLTS